MCVIAFSPKGTDIPSPAKLTEMWTANPHGAGYAYVKQGRVIFRKGIMTLEELLEELKNPEKFKSTNFAIHFRIATSGRVDEATCHPFPVSSNFGKLRRLEGEEDAVLFHNGILGDGGISNPAASDTQDFVIATEPLFRKYGKSITRDKMVEDLVRGSKILVMYGNGKVKMYGEWEKDGDLLVSNKWYYYGSFTKYYSPSPLPPAKQVTINTQRAETQESKRLWAELLRKEYLFITEEDVAVLKRSADDYSEGHIERGGVVIGYDLIGEIAWVEETPPRFETPGLTEGGLDA